MAFVSLSRCQCQRCNDQNLVRVLEFRCCREVANAAAKLTFDGSIERISCITQHDDYAALTNRVVDLRSFRLRVVSPTVSSPTPTVVSPTSNMSVRLRLESIRLRPTSYVLKSNIDKH